MLTILQKDMLSNGGAEMSESEIEFLLNLIDKRSPYKLVEVGVAAGGTTAIIVEHLKRVRHKCKMFSIDKSPDYYRDNSKKTGYHAIDYIKSSADIVEHNFLFGKYAVEYAEQIGSGIDFLILDTVHSLPGELLDFLGFLPYLSEGTVVVLHDVCLNHMSDNIAGFATQVLLDVVSGEKIFDVSMENGYSNIGAFIVNENTRKNIQDVFRALLISWRYIPDQEQLSIYREEYKKHYTNWQVEVFDRAIELNKGTVNRWKQRNKSAIKDIMNFAASVQGKNVFIYGCGFYGKKLNKLLGETNISVKGFVVSDGQNTIIDDLDKPILCLSDYIIQSNRNDVIVLGVGGELAVQLRKQLKIAGIKSCVEIPAYMLEFM